MAVVLFFAVVAAAQNLASQKITQSVVKGKLEQTVFAGDNIEPVKIVYENTGIDENKSPEHEATTDFLTNFGLSKSWTKGPACEISGQMNRNIAAGTYKAYIVVQDDEGKLFKTELIFNVKEKSFSLEWNDFSGPMNQEVEAGKTITAIVFDYDGIKSWGVGGLPSGLTKRNDEENHRIMIVGTVDADEMSGDYNYTVLVKNDQGEEIVKTGTITVKGSQAHTSIRVVENELQKVVAGNEIKPVVFQFANVPLDENLSAFNTSEGSLKGTFKYSVEGNTLTVIGTVAETLGDGTYSIKIIAVGENNRDTAFALVEVTHKPVVTKVSVTENASQTLNVGDSIKPIVFQIENGSDPKITNFPGGYELRKNGNTATIVGLVEESARGQYDVVLSVTGVDNNASAKATIEVIPGTMTFELVEGSDNQTVVAGQEIVPIVYQYNHVKKIDGKGIPADLEVVQDKEKKLVTISGAVNSKSATHEYVYTFELTDFYGETMTVAGKVNVVAKGQSSSSSADESSSSSKEPEQSSSSEETKQSSSSEKNVSSSSEAVSSSSATSSSSAAKSSSSTAESSSSSVEKLSSSSAEKQSSSSTEKLSSSSADKQSSSSTAETTSSSSEEPKSSSSEHTTNIAAITPSFEFGYANNELTVVLPKAAMVRVQVFDLMGHVVETFAESVVSSKNFNLAHLNQGNYVVRIESARYARTAKISVK